MAQVTKNNESLCKGILLAAKLAEEKLLMKRQQVYKGKRSQDSGFDVETPLQ